MFDTSSKKERSLGVPLQLKPFRSASPKSAIVRRPNRPGQHGAGRRRPPSEFSEQLKEKQKFKYTYGLREAQMRRIFQKASKSVSTTGPAFMNLLERRLDNVVFRLGIAPSRSVARQFVSHGHIQVNSKRVKSSSYQVKAGDVIRIRPESKTQQSFKDLGDKLKAYNTPNWLTVDAGSFEGKVKTLPKDLEIPFDISLVVDYYSKLVK
jgi:small subunit ribosomal protein S4